MCKSSAPSSVGFNFGPGEGGCSEPEGSCYCVSENDLTLNIVQYSTYTFYLYDDLIKSDFLLKYGTDIESIPIEQPPPPPEQITKNNFAMYALTILLFVTYCYYN